MFKGASNEEALVTQNSSEKKQQSKVQRLSILALACSFIFLVAGVSVFLTANQSDNTHPESFCAHPDVTLYPGGYERLQIATVPDDTDRGVIECHSDSNPWITATKTADWEDANPWTEAWSVAAEGDWEETLPYSGKVSVMGGEAIPVYIDVTVEEPAYKTAGGSEGLLSGSNDTSNAGEYTPHKAERRASRCVKQQNLLSVLSFCSALFCRPKWLTHGETAMVGGQAITTDEVNNGALGETITFNSISDNPALGGDEKNFVGARQVDSDSNVWNANTIAAEDGEKYYIRMYVHNDNPGGVDAVAKRHSGTF